jgi:hypothetical protein
MRSHCAAKFLLAAQLVSVNIATQDTVPINIKAARANLREVVITHLTSRRNCRFNSDEPEIVPV